MQAPRPLPVPLTPTSPPRRAASPRRCRLLSAGQAEWAVPVCPTNDGYLSVVNGDEDGDGDGDDGNNTRGASQPAGSPPRQPVVYDELDLSGAVGGSGSGPMLDANHYVEDPNYGEAGVPNDYLEPVALALQSSLSASASASASRSTEANLTAAPAHRGNATSAPGGDVAYEEIQMCARPKPQCSRTRTRTRTQAHTHCCASHRARVGR